MRKQLAPTLLILSMSVACVAAEQIVISDEADRINYTIGHQIGTDFKKQQVEFDDDSLRQGILDGHQSVEPRIDRKEMSAALVELKRNISSDMREKALAQMKTRQQKTERIRNEGLAFLQENRVNKGIVETPSGLQYKVITPGSGPNPGLQDHVTLHFRSKTINGKEYNSSYKRGAPHTAKVHSLLPGFSEALQLMSPGAKWELYLPPELAYGRQGPLAHHTIIIEAELLSFDSVRNQQVTSDTQNKP